MIFTDEQWQALRGDYPPELFEKCRQELLPQMIDAAMEGQSDEFIASLETDDAGRFPIDLGRFDAFGWAPLYVGGQHVAMLEARQLWPHVEPVVAWLDR